MQFKLAIFDFDGTLADSVSWFLEMLGYLGERYGFRKLSPTEVEALRGKSSQEILRELGIPTWKLPAIARHMQRLAADAAGRISLFPGIAPLLTDLPTRGVRVGVASSNAEANIRRVLGTEIAAAIAHYECGSSMFGKSKRIRRILVRSGVPASQTIFIGDETRDIEAAHKASVAAAGVLWGVATRAALEAAKPTILFASVDDLRRHLS